MKNSILKIYTRVKAPFALGSRRSGFACIALLVLLTSCKKLVDVPVPTNSLVTASVFNNDASAIATQLAVYANLEGNLYNFDLFTGLSSDELTNYSTGQSNIDLYSNALNAQIDGGGEGLWNNLYFDIYQENAILEGVQSSTGMSSKVKQLLAGEAKFMRAYCYFQLVNLFGDVPLVTSTNYKINSSLARTPKDQIYNWIISDLQSAEGLLSTDYLDPSDNTGSTDRVRPTTWAAHVLLARVYLYLGKYALAEQQTSLVIANTAMFSLVSDLTKVFKMNSAEAIWQLTPPNGTLYTQEGSHLILVAPPDNVTASPQLLNAFEPNDNRRTAWISSYTDGTTTWYFPYKYQDNNQASSLSEYSMVFRLAELYLIRSEARIQQNNLNGALADLNVIRNRAGLANYNGATDNATFLAVIAHERQVELFTENDRWLDLKRTQTIDGVMGVPGGVCAAKGGVWNSYQQLYPLNISDLQYNPKLVQNLGY